METSARPAVRYCFKRFDRLRMRRPRPAGMRVGEIVVRKPSAAYESVLKVLMRKAMREQGMEFSIARKGAEFAIRRDK